MELGFLTSFAIFLFLFFLVAVEDSVGSFSNVAVAIHVSDSNIEDGRGASGPERICSNIAAQLAKRLPWTVELRNAMLPNVGRCDHTYAYHLRTRESTPAVLLFIKDTTIEGSEHPSLDPIVHGIGYNEPDWLTTD